MELSCRNSYGITLTTHAQERIFFRPVTHYVFIPDPPDNPHYINPNKNIFDKRSARGDCPAGVPAGTPAPCRYSGEAGGSGLPSALPAGLPARERRCVPARCPCPLGEQGSGPGSGRRGGKGGFCWPRAGKEGRKRLIFHSLAPSSAGSSGEGAGTAPHRTTAGTARGLRKVERRGRCAGGRGQRHVLRRSLRGGRGRGRTPRRPNCPHFPRSPLPPDGRGRPALPWGTVPQGTSPGGGSDRRRAEGAPPRRSPHRHLGGSTESSTAAAGRASLPAAPRGRRRHRPGLPSAPPARGAARAAAAVGGDGAEGPCSGRASHLPRAATAAGLLRSPARPHPKYRDRTKSPWRLRTRASPAEERRIKLAFYPEHLRTPAHAGAGGWRLPLSLQTGVLKGGAAPLEGRQRWCRGGFSAAAPLQRQPAQQERLLLRKGTRPAGSGRAPCWAPRGLRQRSPRPGEGSRGETAGGRRCAHRLCSASKGAPPPPEHLSRLQNAVRVFKRQRQG